MADENTLENLSGPTPVPPSLGEAPVNTPQYNPISTGSFDKKTQEVTNALINGVGVDGNPATVKPAFGTDNVTTVNTTESFNPMAPPPKTTSPSKKEVKNKTNY